MIAVVLVGGWRLERRRRPELWIFVSTVVNIQVMLALGTVLTGGPESFLVNTDRPAGGDGRRALQHPRARGRGARSACC